jgi:hypothetical protein
MQYSMAWMHGRGFETAVVRRPKKSRKRKRESRNAEQVDRAD